MLLDNVITIGKSHNICEDYSLIGDKDNPFLCVSDGCSSSKNTDMGARLLCWAFKDFLTSWHDEIKIFNNKSVGRYIISQAQKIAKEINLNFNALDSTLITTRIFNNDIMIDFFGDGYLIVKYKAGAVYLFKISYTENAPFYLNVFNDPVITKKWQTLYPDNILQIEIFDICDNDMKIQTPSSLDYYSFNWDCESIDSVFIATDGLGSFINNTGASLGIKEIVKDLLDIKIRNGEYLKRRMKKMLFKYQALGYTNYDDIAVASIIF